MSKAVKMTRSIAYAIGLDAGNASMRAAGRTVWSEDDFNAASAATARALELVGV
jgi:hypothetical protein